jgi:proteic killer suppression protein
MTWLFAFGYSLEEIEKLFGSKNFEHLKGERDDECSIRVNKQYRICFKWKPTRPYEIEFNKHY